MRQFDLIANPDPVTRRHSPLLVVSQSHHLDPLDTIFLTPAVRDAKRPVTSLDVQIEFNGERLILAIAESAAVPRIGYGRVVGSVIEHQDAIRRAFERLLGGF